MTSSVGLSITPRKLAIWLGSIIAVLVVMSVVVRAIRFLTGEDGSLVNMFHLGHERNLPTYFSALQLLIASGLCALISTSQTAYRRYWIGLSLIFCLLSVDEMTELHEQMHGLGRMIVKPEGIFLYAWIVPGIILVGVFGLAYLRFFLNLPRHVRFIVGLAGTLYVGGALGLEAMSAFVTAYGMGSAVHFVVQTLEETLEMVGITVFIYGVTSYLSGIAGVIELHLRDAPGRREVLHPSHRSGPIAVLSTERNTRGEKA